MALDVESALEEQMGNSHRLDSIEKREQAGSPYQGLSFEPKLPLCSLPERSL